MSSKGGMMKCVCLKDQQPAFRQTCPLGAVFAIQCKCLLVVLLLFGFFSCFFFFFLVSAVTVLASQPPR